MAHKLERYRRQMILREAEGYLELEMPSHALEALTKLQPQELGGHGAYLQGEALRTMERYEEAIPHLRNAASLCPSEIGIWVALGWCYKRTGSLDRAIKSLQEALEVSADNALVNYNLACYYSLAQDRALALQFLVKAVGLDARFRELMESESDFDPIRNHPLFRVIAAGKSVQQEEII